MSVRIDIRRADNTDVLLLSYPSARVPQLKSLITIDPLVGNIPVVHEHLRECDSLAKNGPTVVEVLVEVEE